MALKVTWSACFFAQRASAEAFHNPMNVVNIADVLAEFINRRKLFETELAFVFVHVNMEDVLHELGNWGSRLILRTNGTEWRLENGPNY